MNEDQLIVTAEREIDLYRNEVARVTAQRDEAREQLASLRRGIERAVAGLEESARATSPSKKSAIEAAVAARLCALLEGQ